LTISALKKLKGTKNEEEALSISALKRFKGPLLDIITNPQNCNAEKSYTCHLQGCGSCYEYNVLLPSQSYDI